MLSLLSMKLAVGDAAPLSGRDMTVRTRRCRLCESKSMSIQLCVTLDRYYMTNR